MGQTCPKRRAGCVPLPQSVPRPRPKTRWQQQCDSLVDDRLEADDGEFSGRDGCAGDQAEDHSPQKGLDGLDRLEREGERRVGITEFGRRHDRGAVAVTSSSGWRPRSGGSSARVSCAPHVSTRQRHCTRCSLGRRGRRRCRGTAQGRKAGPARAPRSIDSEGRSSADSREHTDLRARKPVGDVASCGRENDLSCRGDDGGAGTARRSGGRARDTTDCSTRVDLPDCAASDTQGRGRSEKSGREVEPFPPRSLSLPSPRRIVAPNLLSESDI